MGALIAKDFYEAFDIAKDAGKMLLVRISGEGLYRVYPNGTASSFRKGDWPVADGRISKEGD